MDKSLVLIGGIVAILWFLNKDEETIEPISSTTKSASATPIAGGGTTALDSGESNVSDIPGQSIIFSPVINAESEAVNQETNIVNNLSTQPTPQDPNEIVCNRLGYAWLGGNKCLDGRRIVII